MEIAFISSPPACNCQYQAFNHPTATRQPRGLQAFPCASRLSPQTTRHPKHESCLSLEHDWRILHFCTILYNVQHCAMSALKKANTACRSHLQPLHFPVPDISVNKVSQKQVWKTTIHPNTCNLKEKKTTWLENGVRLDLAEPSPAWTQKTQPEKNSWAKSQFVF